MTHRAKHGGLSTGKMAVWLLCNAAVTIGAVILAPIWILWVVATPRHRRTLRKRLGFSFRPSTLHRNGTGGFRLWVHALSVGEVHASQALVNGLLNAYPDIDLTLTASTLTGFQTAQRLFGDRCIDLAYYPLDWIVSIQMVANRIDPDAVILIETDIWPNFLTAMQWRGVPVYLVNMRLSDRAFRTFMRLKWVARRLLGAFEMICVQTRQDLARLGRIGIESKRVAVTGNIKFDDEAYSASDRTADHWPELLAAIDHRQVIVAGSTHEGEETQLLAALKVIEEQREPPLLILVPRNPDRSRHLSDMCDDAGRSGCLLSRLLEGRGLRRPEVVVVDFIGALKRLYALADIAFVGGSLCPEGGHNPLEPAAFAKPVLFGPDMRDFHHITEMLKRAGGARQLAPQQPLGPLLLELLSDSASAKQMGQRARGVFLSNKGAVQKTLGCLNLEREHKGSGAAFMTKARHTVFADFRKKVVGVIAGDTSHPLDPLTALLHGFSWLYKCLIVMRNRLYDHQVLLSARLPCAVVSVGNLAVGGTGKTPMTVYLVKQIQALGYRPAVLSRGYKGRYEKKGAVVSDGRSILYDARQAGDEPYLLATLLPTVPVIVGSDRTRAGRMALDRFAPDVLVLDDAFQHRRLHRDLDILLLDGRAPFGNSFVLPRGPMREPVQALHRCHAIVLTRCPAESSAIHRNVAGMVRPRPVFRTHHRPLVRGLLPADHCPDQHHLDQRLGESALQSTSRRVYAFSGLARNQAFLDTAEQMCGELTGHMGFEDHHPYRPVDMQRITAAAHANGSDCLVTTDKDFVRLPQSIRLPLPLLVLGIRIEFNDGGGAFHRFIEQQLERIITGGGAAASHDSIKG